MHKQHPQTAYRKDAVLTGTIFENCDKRKTSQSKPAALPAPLPRGASGEKEKFPVLPKPLLVRRGGIAKQ